MADYAIHDTTLTDIANKIRKKDGTSALIDPADYADRIDLMGMLEVKSVSSALVNISDGADDVPTKSLVVTIPATLEGVSEVNAVRSGKNILNDEDAVKTANNIRFYYTNGKYYSAGTYTLSISENVLGIYVRNISTGTNITVKYNTNFVTFTLTEQTLIGFDFYKVGINQNDNVMLEVGSTATAFEPYAPTQYTVSLGRTIHGGTADIVNGEGQVTGVMIDLSQVEWTNFTTSGNRLYINTAYPNIKAPATNADIPECVCNVFPTISRANMGYSAPFTRGITIDRDGLLIIANPDDATWTSKEAAIASLAQMGAVCVIPIATPTDFTFTGQEVPTRLGYNAFWSDEGDTEVTYRSSGTIHQYPRGEEASF